MAALLPRLESCASTCLLVQPKRLHLVFPSYCMQRLQVHGFISFALGTDLLSRFLNLVMFLLMVVKYLGVMHMNTKKLLPRLPHLLVSVSTCAMGCGGLACHPSQASGIAAPRG